MKQVVAIIKPFKLDEVRAVSYTHLTLTTNSLV